MNDIMNFARSYVASTFQNETLGRMERKRGKFRNRRKNHCPGLPSGYAKVHLWIVRLSLFDVADKTACVPISSFAFFSLFLPRVRFPGAPGTDNRPVPALLNLFIAPSLSLSLSVLSALTPLALSVPRSCSVLGEKVDPSEFRASRSPRDG